MNDWKTIATTLVTLVCLLLAALPAAAAEDAGGATESVVNINQASATELARLPRVGPALAQRIIDFREENGPFEHPDDLLLVRGIGEKTYAMMAPYVAVEGETTLMEKAKPKRSDR